MKCEVRRFGTALSSSLACFGMTFALTYASGTVRTLAGDGTAAIVDGPGSVAKFMYPQALAYDASTHAIVVADAGAQRIRVVDDAGNVTTLAGTGEPQSNGLSVRGGYLDGPDNTARFDGPAGVAIGRDGVVYVADEFNHCVRAIAHGSVSTFAGAPSRPETTDGARDNASFFDPRSVAVSSDGTVYVDDYGNGIHAIKDGIVSPVPIPAPYGTAVTNIAVLDGARPALFGAVRAGVWRLDLRSRAFAVVTTTRRSPAAFAPFAVAPLDYDSFVASSLLYDAVFFGSFPGFAGSRESKSRQIAGVDEKDPTFVGGFGDGLADRARFYNPSGIVLDGDGNAIVADAGNRRIRAISKDAVTLEP